MVGIILLSLRLIFVRRLWIHLLFFGDIWQLSVRDTDSVQVLCSAHVASASKYMTIEMRQMQSQIINFCGPCLSVILYGERRVGKCTGWLRDKTCIQTTITPVHYGETQWETWCFTQDVCLQAASSFYRMKISQRAVVEVCGWDRLRYVSTAAHWRQFDWWKSASNQDKFNFSRDAFWMMLVFEDWVPQNKPKVLSCRRSYQFKLLLSKVDNYHPSHPLIDDDCIT